MALRWMETSSFEPNINTLTSLVHGHCKAGDAEAALDVVDRIYDEGGNETATKRTPQPTVPASEPPLNHCPCL